jgi:hypothetical protein
MTMVDKTQIRFGPLAGAIEARTDGAPAATVRRDLERYYALLSLALASVELSTAEASLIVDALNGTAISLTTAQMLAAEIEDALEDGLAEKWGVDGAALVATIGAWTLAQRMAVLDACERFWISGSRVAVMADRLAAVGLVRRP